jgi:iron only hydrogenase large subunit-like protein
MYHVTVMPCYDKKLEASRQDFYDEQYRTRDVDCVITTGELEVLLHSRGWDLALPLKSTSLVDHFGIPRLMSHVGSSSGGWLQSIVQSIQEREQRHGRETSVRTKTIRTADYEDITVEAFSDDGATEVVFRGAKCFGFRNLQNIVRKVAKESNVKGAAPGASRGRVTGATAALRARRAKASSGAESPVETPGSDRPYDYVEVMACPGGCVNGGGQARRPLLTTTESTEDLVHGDTSGMGTRWGDREWVKVVEQTYWIKPYQYYAVPDANNMAKEVLDDLCDGIETSEGRLSRRHALLRTQYRAVVSDVIGLNVKW